MTDPAAHAQHILTYAESWRGGGVERVQLRLVRGWIAAGRRVTLVIGDAAGPLMRELPEGAEVVALQGRGMVGLLESLPGIVAARRPDVIFCPGNHYSGAAAWLRMRLGRQCPPIFAKISNALRRSDQPFPIGWGYRRWLRLHPRFLAGVVAMTPAMAEEAARMMAMPRERIAVIANPPPLPQPPALPDAAPVALPEGRFLLGVGRLMPQKRWERLIAALPRLADRDIALVILGEGRMRAALEAQIASLGLSHRVALPGHVPDPMAAIARAAAVVLVSDFEGVPGALREALALGTPVVTTESSVAVREIVTGPELGSIVPIGDEAALVAALDLWLAPGQPRPVPVPPPGMDAAAEYLAMFDRWLEGRTARPARP